MAAGDNLFFYQQKKYRTTPKRFRKLPEDLPENLKYAHLNPKVAVYLASKDRQKQEEALAADGLSKKSLMPEISQAFMSVKNRLDSSMSNDEDSQRYLFEQAHVSANTVLMQLARIIYNYENIASCVPRSLEYQLMCGVKELTANAIIVPREWQTLAMKEAHAKLTSSAQETHSDDEGDVDSPGNVPEEGKSSRAPSVMTQAGPVKGRKKVLTKGLPEITENTEAAIGEPARHGVRPQNDSRLSAISRIAMMPSRRERGKFTDKGSASVSGRTSGLHLHDFDHIMSSLAETPSEFKLLPSMANSSYYMSIIQFQLSSKICEEKGWIMQKGSEDELAKEAILEWCIHTLHRAMKIINEQKSLEKKMGHDQPVQIRYYGDTRKETLLKYRKSPVKAAPSPAAKGDKPKIPDMYCDKNEGKQLMLTGHLDGTMVAYYPSGQPAVVCSAAGFGRTGFYTIAYNDGPDMKMLACFTPSGCGVCYHSNGNIKFLATSKGGHLADCNGALERRWKWPPGGVKITLPVAFQLNAHISFRCVSESYMMLSFSCLKETARFPVGVNQSVIKPSKAQDEPDELLTTFNFSSKASKNLLRMKDSKSKSHKSKGKKRDRLDRQLAELVKSVDSEEKMLYDIKSDKELAQLQRKTRNLIDDWMEHYRIAIGLPSPSLTSMPDSPRHVRTRRETQSAKPWEGDKAQRQKDLGVGQKESFSSAKRTPSAPAEAPKRQGSIGKISIPSPKRSVGSLTVQFDQTADTAKFSILKEGLGVAEGERLVASLTDLSKYTESVHLKSKSSSCMLKQHSRQAAAALLKEKEVQSTSLLCPPALRSALLGEPKVDCRCSHHSIPFITDVEFDAYITKQAPSSQMQIVIIVSSLYPKSHPAEKMMEHIYSTQNRNRTRPCPQSREDLFRIFKYDVCTATEGLDHRQPMLLTRHNVVPGMFLIYAEGKLLFCDHILNGYGYAPRDFRKQILKSRHDFVTGQSLPNDFRFSPSKGRHGPRSAWGGEIGGAGVDRFGSPGTALVHSSSEPNITDRPFINSNRDENVRNMVKSLNAMFSLHMPIKQRYVRPGSLAAS